MVDQKSDYSIYGWFLRKQDHLSKPLKEAYEKMMLFSNGKLGKLSSGQVGDLENLLLEALIWPLAE